MREREKELNLRGNWGENYREFKRERSKQMNHNSLMRLELQVEYLYRDLLQILMVVHLAHVPQPIAMLRNHI